MSTNISYPTSTDVDADGVPRRVNGVNRSDLARVKDVVLISRQETAIGVAEMSKALTELSNTIQQQMTVLSASLSEVAENTIRELNRLDDRIVRLEELERSTWRGQVRTFIEWCRERLEKRSTPA